MSFKYLLVKKVGGRINLGISSHALNAFSSSALSFWIISTLALYRREHVLAELDHDAAAFLGTHEKSSLLELGKMSPPANLLMESVLLACEMPARSDLDENLALISAVFDHARLVSNLPVPDYKIRYTLRKHRDTESVKLMTIKGDVMANFGLDGCGLILPALSKAVGRDLGVSISISNAYDIFGEDLYTHRPAPIYADNNVFVMRGLLVNHVYNNLTLPFVKDNVGTLKVLGDYFVSLAQTA